MYAADLFLWSTQYVPGLFTKKKLLIFFSVVIQNKSLYSANNNISKFFDITSQHVLLPLPIELFKFSVKYFYVMGYLNYFSRIMPQFYIIFHILINKNNTHTYVTSGALPSRLTNTSSHHTTPMARAVCYLAVMKRNVTLCSLPAFLTVTQTSTILSMVGTQHRTHTC